MADKEKRLGSVRLPLIEPSHRMGGKVSDGHLQLPLSNSPQSRGAWIPSLSSRIASQGAVRPASSSTNTSDDDDDGLCVDDDTLSTVSYKDRRREAHTFAEQKRRDSIKRGYEELQRLVPTCHQLESSEHHSQHHHQQPSPATSQEFSSASNSGAASSAKLSKAVVLQRSIDYIQHLVQQQQRQSEELQSLQKEVLALRIMKANYEEMVKSHHHSTPEYCDSPALPDGVKMAVYKSLVDNLFTSFNSTVCVSNFAELSACVFYWLEENCKPRLLREMMVGALQRVADEHRQQRHHGYQHGYGPA